MSYRVLRRAVAFVPWFALAGAAACGGGPDGAARRAATIDAGFSPLQGVVRATVFDAGAPDARGDDGARPEAADAAVAREASVPTCIPEAGIDEPDEAFADTNCDGIDGDASRAVFVASTGSDSGAGTLDAPFATIGKGAAVAAASGKSVYVCNGEYAENLRIEKAAVSVYGGYDCANGWRRVADHARVAPASGIPLVLADVAGSVVIDRLSFRAPDAPATDYGSSSVAVSVARAKDVVFRHSFLIAGDGAPGKRGEPTAPAPAPQAAAVNGQSASVTGSCEMTPSGTLLSADVGCLGVPAGGIGAPRLCPDGSVILGGNGGHGANAGIGFMANSGSPGIPHVGDETSGRAGATGANGRPGSAGGAFGHIESGAYVASNGGGAATAGANGEAGIGGEGGESGGRTNVVTTYWIGGGGGQGGYPGCGGAAGDAGTAGGGSIALVADASGVRLVASVIETGHGGNGGDGSAGAPGQQGGQGGRGASGSGDSATSGKNGGTGGTGGHGGAGGPGGGGPSVGIAWTEPKPIIEQTTFTLGTPGTGGVTSAHIAADGIVAEVYPPVESGDAGQGGTP